jgi:hypothetical protein
MVVFPYVYKALQRLRGAVDRDRATNRCRVGFRWFKVALKDDYKGLYRTTPNALG